MREYGQIQSAFWQSPDAQEMTDQGKLLCTYLLAGPNTNGLGCFRLGDGQVQDDLGWPSEKTTAAFAELSRNGWAYRFQGVVLMPNFLKWNKIVNANIAKARFGDFEMLPKGRVKALAARFMLEFCDHWNVETASILETVSQTVTGTVTETLLVTPENQNPTQPNPTIPHPTQPHLVRKRSSNLKAKVDVSGFDQFYSAYPRQISRKRALEAFAKIAPSPELLAVIMASLARQCATAKWQDEPQYIPHPATWLNGERWKDNVASIAANGNAPSKTLSGMAALQGMKQHGNHTEQLALRSDHRRPDEDDEFGYEPNSRR